jgi:hypothetical protein
MFSRTSSARGGTFGGALVLRALLGRDIVFLTQCRFEALRFGVGHKWRQHRRIGIDECFDDKWFLGVEGLRPDVGYLSRLREAKTRCPAANLRRCTAARIPSKHLAVSAGRWSTSTAAGQRR